MRRLILMGVAALGLAACNAELIPADVVIENVTVIDAAQGVRAGMDVAISGGKIIDVNSDIAGYFEAEEVLDGSGKYLIPGLWDAHVHLTFTPGLDHTVFYPLSLAHGITYLRDTGGQMAALAPALAAAQANPSWPDVYVTGPLLDGPKRVYDGHSAGFPNISEAVETPADAQRIVGALVDAGADAVKAYEMLSPTAFKAIADAAHARGVRVVAHVPLSMTARQAARAGADDMQHLRNLEMDCVADPQILLQDRQALLEADVHAHGSDLRSAIHRTQRGAALGAQDADSCQGLLDVLSAEDVFQTPTLTIVTLLTERLYAQPRWQETYAYVPKAIGESWLERSQRLAQRPTSPQGEAYSSWAYDMIKRLNAMGITLMAGTDAPIGFLTPGASLHEELALLVDAGLTPLEAIETATLHPAQFFGLEGTQGTIAPNMAADLVLLSADPLSDIRNTTAIEAVIRSGMVHDRALLDTMLRAGATN